MYHKFDSIEQLTNDIFIFILLHLLLCIFYDTWLLISGYTNLVILKNNLKLKNETINTKNLFIKKKWTKTNI